MQFQLFWRQHHRDLSVPDGILRPNRYAGRIPKSNQFDTHELQKYICALERYINSN